MTIADGESAALWRELRELIGRDGRVVQMISDMAPSDASVADTVAWQRALQRHGIETPIYARRLVSGHDGAAAHIDEYRHRRSDVVVLKYTLWSEVAEWVRNRRLPYGLLYYNVTPHEYFEHYDQVLARETRLGRERLPMLVANCAIAAANAPFGARELLAAGFNEPSVVPILTEPDRADTPRDPAIVEEMARPGTNIVYTGRIAPNKRVEHTIAAFAHYQRIDPRARLYLVGSYETRSPYFRAARRLVEQLGLSDAIQFTGKVSRPRYLTYLAGAHVYLTMSEHEGFCVPLIESARLGVPIIARAAGAIPDTAGDAAILVDRPIPAVVAELIDAVVSDGDLRGWLIVRGHAMAERFAYPRVEATVASFLVEATRRIRAA
ncbi:MAG: glycosyltransferase [Chloroflexota bacterium]|nr:MAG: glycosyltransferase [Chloroflexota bacterium]